MKNKVGDFFDVELYDSTLGEWIMIVGTLSDQGGCILVGADEFVVAIDPEFEISLDNNIDVGYIEDELLHKAVDVMKNLYWERERII